MRNQTIVANETEVRNVPTPAFTNTWHPVSHGSVIDSVQHACKAKGLDVVDEHYTLAGGGSKLFARYTIDSGMNDRRWMLGFRNAIDKSMAVGMVAGLNVVVCSNMQFTGEFLAFHKHTNGLDLERLRIMAETAVVSTVATAKQLDKWHQSLKEVEMTSDDMKCFTFDCMKKGVFAPSRFNGFADCVKEEYELSKERNLYTVHGGVTRLLRDSSSFMVADSTRKLEGLCDEYSARLAA